MYWLKQLADLYGERDVPLFHDEVYTDAEVMLSADGAFLGAEHNRRLTVIPVTEASASRTRGIQPHPLCDSLLYTAGDLCRYIGSAPRAMECSEAYLMQLGEWAHSPCATVELSVVYRYLSQKTLFGDLLRAGVIGGCSETQAQKMTVRFKVGAVRLCEDSGIHKSHIEHTRMRLRCDTLCCVSGELSAAARLHPKRITGGASSAKLISGAALPIGYETSFKAHAVLRRLIREESIRLGGKIFVSWESERGGEVTVLVLQEINRGNLAVTLFGRMDKERYTDIKQQLSRRDSGNDSIAALQAERYLASELMKCGLQEIG